MGSQTLADALHQAVDDSGIAGIILRIDSPGGSYVAADAIWREVKRAKDKGKPLVVSMAGVAASGGYFVAAPAAAIVAEPATITGSIGVFGGKFVIKDLLAKIGVTFDGVSSGTNALIDSPSVDYTPAQWANLQADLDRIYSDFLDKVAQGRGMSKEAVRAVAKGQVWSGMAAKENGLVDKLGGLLTAVDLLRPLAKIGRDAPVSLEQYPKNTDRLRAAVARLMGIDGNTELGSPFTRLLRIAGPVLGAIDAAAGPAPDERLRAPLP
jgi:protease-4